MFWLHHLYLWLLPTGYKVRSSNSRLCIQVLGRKEEEGPWTKSENNKHGTVSFSRAFPEATPVTLPTCHGPELWDMTTPSEKNKKESWLGFCFVFGWFVCFVFIVNINKLSKIQVLRVRRMRRMDIEAASSVCYTGLERKFQQMPKNPYPTDHWLWPQGS